ncbi:MAG: hypothetical protein ED556_04075 [Winogradskyella sp.]|uniref:cytochrome c oxidase assembly factor Coa1 family protein n=1 Tax=Winogradskyella sp. TaxID=1883156 RepID=UPI000F40EBFB|nr:cytochrome c oxidase assembly factor Coa1 family protein [Winogradskyella sp.]RNC88372.1 MAG: hypothetical protein ED556_04075 [Winogradskyella sp.]
MEEREGKSWFSRNWGWVLGGGCLTLIVIVGLIIGGAIFKVVDTVKESETYNYAVGEASKNKEVIGFLGEPIETDGIGNTSYNYINGKTSVDLTIPIKGPKDEGDIFISAEKTNGEWDYKSLYVKIDGETEVINLLDTIEDSSDDF